MKLRILIVDDEPLVQIGLKSMLAGDFPDVEIVGSAGNGRDALKQIGELRPDIVISDIKMPVMGGLELMEEAGRRFGGLPVFILLTAYEDFELARRAVAGNAADYLVKIELSAETLRESIKRAGKRVAEQVSFQDKAFDKTPGEASLEEFRQKFMLAHLNHLYTDREIFLQKARENNMDFSYNRYILVYGELGQSVRESDEENRQWNLYTSCLNMVREIVARYAPCYTVSIDIRHFALIFYFKEAEAVAGAMEQIRDGLENIVEMIGGYFSTDLTFGIGTAVSDPMDIHTSYEEALTACSESDKNMPIRLFSHIVGSNRRSGKDKLIASIREYVEQNISENGKLTLPEVAEKFGLSPAYLSSIFKKNAEMGFSEYVYTRKIEKAKELLLKEDMKVYEVADALGFESAYYFSKVFKRVEGVSPRDYVNSKL